MNLSDKNQQVPPDALQPKGRRNKEKERYRIILSSLTDVRTPPKTLTLRPFPLLCLVCGCVIGLVFFLACTVLLAIKGVELSAKYRESRTEVETLANDLNQRDSQLDVFRARLDKATNELTITGEELDKLHEDMEKSYSQGYMDGVDSAQVYAPAGIRGKVELLDWFQGGADLFARHTKATVIDVATGLRFHVERMGGTYHADSQPLTKEDTDTFLQIAGGEWTWDRRPIWVYVDGRYIAASMNCMPHEPNSNPENGFPGHFCIHFYNSLVHETGKTETRHVAAVRYAYEFGNRQPEKAEPEDTYELKEVE